MMRLPVLLCCLVLAGCAGTQVSRGSEPHPYAAHQPGAMFGGYPFKAVVIDYQIEERSGGEGNSQVVFTSLAVDLLVDLVLLPIDLVAWACGYDKRDSNLRASGAWMKKGME